jgi:hypothetical protein
MVGLKLKNICNFIDNSKLKKNSNKKEHGSNVKEK